MFAITPVSLFFAVAASLIGWYAATKGYVTPPAKDIFKRMAILYAAVNTVIFTATWVDGSYTRSSYSVTYAAAAQYFGVTSGEKQPLQITSQIAGPDSFSIPAALASADELQLRVPGPDGRSRLMSVPTSKVTFVTEEGALASLFPFTVKVST